MKLYYAETLNPRKACAAAKYLNSPVEFVRLELLKGEHKQPAYLAHNPNGCLHEDEEVHHRRHRSGPPRQSRRVTKQSIQGEDRWNTLTDF